MARKHFTSEQIIKKLREAEVLQSTGETVEQICRKLGVSDVSTTVGARNMEGCR